MATLISFSEDVFNSVRHIDGLAKEEFKDPAESLKQLVFQHDLRHVVGITLTHKHIGIRQDEVIVGSYDSASNKVVLTYRAITPEDGDLMQTWIPFQFVYGVDFGWMPVAYWDVRSEGSAMMREKFEKVKDSTFLADLSTLLQSQLTGGIANYGMCLLFQSMIEGHETGLMETTNGHERTQWFRAAASVTMPPDSTALPTIWHWNNGTTTEDICLNCYDTCSEWCIRSPNGYHDTEHGH
mmetsp:Transcript_16558/g.36708  ORF Transcript_16558/g.36708 Transcript_16558/m.36708 type:complete len:239 (-) Transcript_16558:287-1003(-)